MPKNCGICISLFVSVLRSKKVQIHIKQVYNNLKNYRTMQSSLLLLYMPFFSFEQIVSFLKGFIIFLIHSYFAKKEMYWEMYWEGCTVRRLSHINVRRELCTQSPRNI